MAEVLPLPLEPATWTAGRPRWGSPSAASAASTRSSPSTIPRGARGIRASRLSWREGDTSARAIAGQMTEHARDPGLHLQAGDDGVDHPVLQEELGALEPGRQRLPDGALDDARTGEADLRLGLGDVDVAEEGEAGR